MFFSRKWVRPFLFATYLLRKEWNGANLFQFYSFFCMAKIGIIFIFACVKLRKKLLR